VRFLAVTTRTDPVRPAVPSLILTVTQVMYTQAGSTGSTGPTGPGVSPLFGSFISTTAQTPDPTNPTTVPVTITYSSSTNGTIDVSGGTYPNSQIIIPTQGTYRVSFSAQCSSTASNIIEIWPVVNGVSVANSNRHLTVQSNTQGCLTVEYIVLFNTNDVLQLYMIGDSNNVGITYYPGNPSTTPAIPDVPSIILTIVRIG